MTTDYMNECVTQNRCVGIVNGSDLPMPRGERHCSWRGEGKPGPCYGAPVASGLSLLRPRPARGQPILSLVLQGSDPGIQGRDPSCPKCLLCSAHGGQFCCTSERWQGVPQPRSPLGAERLQKKRQWTQQCNTVALVSSNLQGLIQEALLGWLSASYQPRHLCFARVLVAKTRLWALQVPGSPSPNPELRGCEVSRSGVRLRRDLLSSCRLGEVRISRMKAGSGARRRGPWSALRPQCLQGAPRRVETPRNSELQLTWLSRWDTASPEHLCLQGRDGPAHHREGDREALRRHASGQRHSLEPKVPTERGQGSPGWERAWSPPSEGTGTVLRATWGPAPDLGAKGRPLFSHGPPAGPREVQGQ